MLVLAASLSVFVYYSLAVLECSVHYKSTCDGGNATLDTTGFYEKYTDCEWSLRDQNDINHKLLTPFPNVTVQCSLPEINLKVHCISPKTEDLACYKLLKITGENKAQIDPNIPAKNTGHVIGGVGETILLLLLLLLPLKF
ncbi:hypothetical protein HF521_017289 [Silurus meridionalis]|uniref:Uncharacterized protein n=1 Tax=Silurus meridionalis TaxID=175797 RepID=A0A8T0BLU0_SILME|nr:hypothetical protein HF521_017289 [Silurus meridionalis]